MKKLCIIAFALMLILSFSSCAQLDDEKMIGVYDEMLEDKDTRSEIKSIQNKGYIAMLVKSGSMEPLIMTGDIIAIDSNDKDIGIDDVIVFIEGDYYVCHRVIGVDEDGNYITKGDANNVEDSNHASPENVVGKVVLDE